MSEVSGILDQLAVGAGIGASGSVAALSGALSAALLTMSARASSSNWEGAGAALAQAHALRARLEASIASDAAAYERARALLAQASDAHEPSADASRALADALRLAAIEPLRIAEACADVSALAVEVARFCVPEHRADAVGAATLAAGAARAAAHLVASNLAMRTGDELVARATEAAALAGRSAEDAAAG